MDQFAALKAFVAVTEAGGFAPAARKVGQATSSLTRQIDGLERHLGVRLFNRSTRSVTLTDEGSTYLDRIRSLLEDLEDADASISERDGEPRGHLRISAPVAFGQRHVAPMLAGFSRAYPAIKVEVVLSDSLVNLVENRIDIAIRMGSLPPSSLIARKLAPLDRVLCASPGYLKENGEPLHPEDLAAHRCLCFAYDSGPQKWLFDGDGETHAVKASGPLSANNTELLAKAAKDGAGLVLLPTWLVGEDIRQGRLQTLLPDWQARIGEAGAHIHAVYLPSRKGSRKLQLFLRALKTHLGDPVIWAR